MGANDKLYLAAENKDELVALDCAIDQAVCGCALADPGTTRFAKQGAHDPTPTPYFILEELFGFYDFTHTSHLLDVGCGMGRALAHFTRAGFAGRATGVELDPDLASQAAAWAARHENLQVICGDALDLTLNDYTDFYLFNPFDTSVLLQFLSALEAQLDHPATLVHMSDNGETYFYMGRPGFSLVTQGAFQKCRNARGRAFPVYDCAQTYSVWRYTP